MGLSFTKTFLPKAIEGRFYVNLHKLFRDTMYICRFIHHTLKSTPLVYIWESAKYFLLCLKLKGCFFSIYITGTREVTSVCLLTNPSCSIQNDLQFDLELVETENTTCPLCGESFPLEIIEMHADICADSQQCDLHYVQWIWM